MRREWCQVFARQPVFPRVVFTWFYLLIQAASTRVKLGLDFMFKDPAALFTETQTHFRARLSRGLHCESALLVSAVLLCSGRDEQIRSGRLGSRTGLCRWWF